MKYVKNEEAVSPVIGVILMVVITVIIAAILAVFAFGIGGPAKAPAAQLKFTAISNSTLGGVNGTLTVNHAGGDALILKNEQISATDAVNTNVNVVNASLMSSISWIPTVTTGTIAPGQTEYTNATGLIKGQILRVQILDVPTGQMVTDTQVTVQ